ncbi:hypothetical protein I8J29_01640 [Paenibacillus sp. MWE-103]|uniref:Uncharacterized protein n=1 Tax=Paenibacillus artemisiicola TaxID=1172618 RepID=A0ABS3W3M1_9BACL|nr:hypothetical protein [Paenibacillus artemisiicola]MBO7742880.1 hypothetical protein [Paenibacillus artemisiicola]
MRDGRHGPRGPHDHRDHRGHRGPEHDERGKHRFQSAQTFRRGRAIAFLERLQVRRSTLLQQLNQPEYDTIKPIISGELKATDAIIQEFIHSFELLEAEPAVDPAGEPEQGGERAGTDPEGG